MTFEPDSLILRMLVDMRKEHATAMEAVAGQIRSVNRLFDNMSAVPDRFDEMDANLLAFRQETGKALRQIQSDMIAMENQNIARHGETVGLMNRMRDAEARIDERQPS